MRALILAAGYGTRLYPYIKNFPKPLLEVNNRPIIDYLIDKLAKIKGLSRISVVTNARFFKHFQKWRMGLEIKDKVHIINDRTTSPENKLGAIKDMYLAFEKEGLNDDYLVLGGDNFFEEPLDGFMDFARKKHPAVTIGLFDVKKKSEARYFGVVHINQKKKVMEFVEKPAKPKSSLVATCVYYLPREKLNLTRDCIKDSLASFDNVGSYISWLVDKDEVYGFTFKKMWVDIGRMEIYQKLNQVLKGEE